MYFTQSKENNMCNIFVYYITGFVIKCLDQHLASLRSWSAHRQNEKKNRVTPCRTAHAYGCAVKKTRVKLEPRLGPGPCG